jgi:hypothetical protein
MFVKGSMRRQVVTTGGEIHERGEPFPEEIGMEGDTPDRRIVAVMARLGVCLIGHVLPEADALGEPVRIFVCRSRNTSPEVIAALAGQSHKRPWWKFW